MSEETSIPKEQWGVHKNHCCIYHGCKYGDEDCPVELDLIEQQQPCQDCDDYFEDEDEYLEVLTEKPTEADRESLRDFIKGHTTKMSPEERQHIIDLGERFKLEDSAESWWNSLGEESKIKHLSDYYVYVEAEHIEDLSRNDMVILYEIVYGV